MGGLSTCHICTRATGGSFFHLSGGPYLGGVEAERAKRGTITEFSRGARHRMMTSLAVIDRQKAGLPSMFTLTYPDEMPIWPIRESKVKRDLRVFRRRFVRKYGKKAVLWRRENQIRKSGVHKGEPGPHVHGLAWDVEPGAEGLRWISENWYEVVGSGEEKHRRAGTNWFQPESWRGVLAYVSKYFAKVEDVQVKGRSWGYWHRELLPVKLISEEIPVESFHPVRRVLRAYIARQTGRKPRVRDRWSGLSAFLSERTGENLVAWARDIARWKGTGGVGG